MALPIVLGLAGCGDITIGFGNGYCYRDDHEHRDAIVVEFVARTSGQPVAVAASGFVDDGRTREPMVPVGGRGAGAGRTFALAGGGNRDGVFDVDVATGFGETFRWSHVRVGWDACGTSTRVLQAALTQY